MENGAWCDFFALQKALDVGVAPAHEEVTALRDDS
jgi:hypothetical protein